MTILANPKHEAFAQGLANGLIQIDAYEAAGYPRSPSSASQLANKEEVRTRVSEIIAERQAASQRRADENPDQPVDNFDKAWATRQLQKNITLAQSGGQISAANKAVELLLELHGLTQKKKGAEPDEAANQKDQAPTDSLGDLRGVMESLHHLVPPKAPAAA